MWKLQQGLNAAAPVLAFAYLTRRKKRPTEDSTLLRSSLREQSFYPFSIDFLLRKNPFAEKIRKWKLDENRDVRKFRKWKFRLSSSNFDFHLEPKNFCLSTKKTYLLSNCAELSRLQKILNLVLLEILVLMRQFFFHSWPRLCWRY